MADPSPNTDDCFHMISQLSWEDEVLWDGQDEAHRILNKIGKKCHAAGWIPSAMHRRASDFNHQVRDTATIPQTSNINSSINQQGSSGGTNANKGANKSDKSNANKQSAEENDTTWYSIFPVENEDLVYGAWEYDVIWDPSPLKNMQLNSKLMTLDPNDDNIIFAIPDDRPTSQHDHHGHHSQSTSSNGHNLSHSNSNIQLSRKALAQQQSKDKNARKTKIILAGKSGVIVEPEMVSPPPEDSAREKRPWNVSNDEYYTYKITPDVAIKPNIGNLIQHSTPAVELRQPFFPTFMNRDRLREFHRPPLFVPGKKSRSSLSSNSALANLENTLVSHIESLTKHIQLEAKRREQKRIESGGGEMFFMHSPEDLSGKDSELLLFEYSEEYPPLLNQVGMATKIKNYMRRKQGSSTAIDMEAELSRKYCYGEPSIVTTSPFLGNLIPGQDLQTIENNMYRAPIYTHKLPYSDFLVIKQSDQYFIREVETIFTVGQELPIIEVPGPNSKKANNFIRDFLQVYIYRMFWRSPLEPKRIKMDDIKKAFPLHSESSIRKRLKQCADFNRTGDNPNMWYLKKPGEFRLPQEAEIRQMVTPEQCCAYYSMQAAERRLQDAGYGEKSLSTLEDDDDEDKQREMDDEVKAAPWNTTRAFISAMKQKCLLQLTGVADPTGCNEGFSYVRVPNKPLLSKEEAVKEPQPKKTVTGTDADLRRLKLSTAKAMLRDSGIAEDKIAKLPRWQVIHLVRELSTKQVRAGEESMSKFARGNRFSIAEHQERYKEECQRIFDLQNKVLASDEVLSTDDEESNDEDDPEIEQVTKTLEIAIENKKSSQALFHEREEAERRDLHKMMFGNDDTNSNDPHQFQSSTNNLGHHRSSQAQMHSSNTTKDAAANCTQPDESSNLERPSNVERVLKIKRTFIDNSGRQYERTETVRKQAVIDSYVKIRKTRDSDQIREFAASMDGQREGKRKERKQQNRAPTKRQTATFFFNQQHRESHSSNTTPRTTAPNSPSSRAGPFHGELFANSERNQFSSNDDESSSQMATNTGSNQLSTVPGVKKRKEKDGSKLKCSACGGLGHMKNNKSCPEHPQSIQVAMTNEQYEEQLQSSLCSMDIIKTEDTKIRINKRFIETIEESRKNAIKLRIPMNIVKRKRSQHKEDLDYLKKPYYKSTSSGRRGRNSDI